MHQAKRQLHVNPMVSMSQGLEHALRYAAGLKKYRTAQETGVPLQIAYNADLSPRLSHGAQHPPILGVVIVLATTADYVRHHPKLHVVLQLKEQNQLKVSDRIASEEEVTTYGGMPAAPHSRVLLRWPLPLPDLRQGNSVLQDYYGVTRAEDAAFISMRARAADIHSNPDDSMCQRRFRAELAVAAGRAIIGAIHQLYGITIALDARVVRNTS